MDIWHTTRGLTSRIQHRNYSMISKQSAESNSRCPGLAIKLHNIKRHRNPLSQRLNKTYNHTHLNKLIHHPNEYVQDIISTLLPTRLKKHRPNDLPQRFTWSSQTLSFFLSFYFILILFLIMVLLQNSQVSPWCKVQWSFHYSFSNVVNPNHVIFDLLYKLIAHKGRLLMYTMVSNKKKIIIIQFRQIWVFF